jgi:hypothetical protein
VGQGRNPSVAAVDGHDRCDPTAGTSADQAACAHILDQRANEFSNGAAAPPPTQVPTDASSSGLVNDVVTGGTGTVVPLPPK